MILGSLLLAVSLPAATADPFTGRPLYQPRLFPEYPAADDKRYIGYYDFCGEGATRAPARLVRTNTIGTYTLDLQLVDPDVICFATPPPFSKTLHLVELPRDLPIDRVDVTIVQGQNEIASDSIRVPAPWPLPPSITGAWNNPEKAAQGVYFAFSTLPTAAGVMREAVVMTWTTYDNEGRQLWLTGTAPLLPGTSSPVDIVLYETNGGQFPAPGPGTPPSLPTIFAWGTARVTYLGCDRLTLRWMPSGAFVSGEMELRQLAYGATQPCDIERFEADRYRSVKIVNAELDD